MITHRWHEACGAEATNGNLEDMMTINTGRKAAAMVPLLADLAAVMTEAPALMAALATEFAPTAAQLSTQRAYWLAVNGWITDRLAGPIMEGKARAQSLGEQAW